MEEMTGMPEMEPERATPGGFRRGIGKLLLVLAGMGVVALTIFVAMPMLLAPAPESVPMVPEEIVAEVLSEPADRAAWEPAQETRPEDVPGIPTPLVARKHGGGELPVVFPAAEEAAASDADEGGMPDTELPPVLNPEEIEAALVVPETPETGSLAEPIPQPEPRPVTVPLPESPQQPIFQTWETILPPFQATREVQELLESLGYEPGPVDGVWGHRTDRSWKNFASDVSDMDTRTVLDQVPLPTPGPADASIQPEEPAAPSGGIGVEAAHGAGQAGPPQAGLQPPDSARQGEQMRVRGTLRGIMGYRLPLVSRQEVPDQVVSGVLIPAHTTFVILRGGELELTGLEHHEVERLKGERAGRQPEALAPNPRPKPQKRGWKPLRLFRRQPTNVDGQ